MTKATLIADGITVTRVSGDRLVLAFTRNEEVLLEYEPVGPIYEDDSIGLTKVRIRLEVTLGTS